MGQRKGLAPDHVTSARGATGVGTTSCTDGVTRQSWRYSVFGVRVGPVGRVAYVSTMACVPVSLSQEVGMALGAQAGQAKLTEVIKAGGFSEVRRAAETKVNMVLEARL